MIHDLQILSQRFLKLKNESYQRYFIREVALKGRLNVILGQRGVGKTTTLIQYLLRQASGDVLDPRILYIQADHFLMGDHTLYGTAEEFHNLGGIWLAIDEIHKYPDWSKELKSIYDTFPGLQVTASGSSLLEITKGTHDLVRRAITHQMEGVSFREYLELTLEIKIKSLTLEQIVADHVAKSHQIIEQIEAHGSKVLIQFKNYLRTGYYPYYTEIQDEQAYWNTVEQNFHATLDSDLMAVYPHLTQISVAKIKKLLTYIAGHVPFTPNWEELKISMDMGDTRTLKTYFKHLEDAGLIRILATPSSKPNLNKAGKVYLNNPNQMYAMTLGTPNIGTLRETFFMSMFPWQHELTLPSSGDFHVSGYVFEVGGKNKDRVQIKHAPNSFLVCDDIETGSSLKIPLWIFGMLY